MSQVTVLTYEEQRVLRAMRKYDVVTLVYHRQPSDFNYDRMQIARHWLTLTQRRLAYMRRESFSNRTLLEDAQGNWEWAWETYR